MTNPTKPKNRPTDDATDAARVRSEPEGGPDLDAVGLSGKLSDIPTFDDTLRAIAAYGTTSDPVALPNPGRSYRRGGFIFRHDGDTLIIESGSVAHRPEAA